MEEDLKKRFIPDATDTEAGSYSPLVLAFLGDAVYETAVRTMLVKRGNARPKDLNRRKNRLVSAEAQSGMMAVLLDELTEEEAEIYRRGRNAKSITTAKNASVSDYRRATGFEALMGYLYLTNRQERLLQLIEKGIEAHEPC